MLDVKSILCSEKLKIVVFNHLKFLNVAKKPDLEPKSFPWVLTSCPSSFFNLSVCDGFRENKQ